MWSIPHGHRSLRQTQGADDITLTSCISLSFLPPDTQQDSNIAGLHDVEIVAVAGVTVCDLYSAKRKRKRADLDVLFVTVRVEGIITAVCRLGLFSTRRTRRHH